MGKKAKQEAKQAIEAPVEGALEREAAYYARKFGLTTEEALRMLKEARTMKPLADVADATKR
ncbi:hypothetical protein NKJ26_29350 [Mesorhizobium sp. M0152]|uniref:hypothetical protein n=1 Tax=Mesorhizobium sp. M0152 TaxID=2956898 RepID=UPI00333A29BE